MKKLKLKDVFESNSIGDVYGYIPSQLYENRVSSHPRIGRGFSSQRVKFHRKRNRSVDQIDMYPYEKKIVDEIFSDSDLIFAFRSGTGSGKSSLVKFLAESVRQGELGNKEDLIVSPIVVCDLQEPNKFACDNKRITDESFNRYLDQFYRLMATKIEEAITLYLHVDREEFIGNLFNVIYSENYTLNGSLLVFKSYLDSEDSNPDQPIAILDTQYAKYKSKCMGISHVELLISYLQAKNLYRRKLYGGDSKQFAPITLIIDNTDKVHYLILCDLFQRLNGIQTSPFSDLAKVKMVLFARLSTSEDTINSLGRINWRSFEAPDVVRVLIARCVKYLLHNDHDFSDDDENEVRSRILMLMLYLTHPKYRLADTIRAVVGTNIRNGMTFVYDYVAGTHVSFGYLNAVQVNTRHRLGTTLQYYTNYQFGIYFQRFASIFENEISPSFSVKRNANTLLKANEELIERMFDPLGSQLNRWLSNQDGGGKILKRMTGNSRRRYGKLVDLISSGKLDEFLKGTKFYQIAIDSVKVSDAALKQKMNDVDKGRLLKLVEERVLTQAVNDLKWGNTKKNIIKSWLPVWMVALRYKVSSGADVVSRESTSLGTIEEKLVAELLNSDIYAELEKEKIKQPLIYSNHSVSLNFLRSVQRMDSDDSPIKLLCLKQDEFSPASCCVLFLISITSNSSSNPVPITIGRVTDFLRSLAFTEEEISECFVQLTKVDNRLVFSKVDDSSRIATELFTRAYASKYIYLTNAGSNLVATQLSATTYFQFQIESLGEDISPLHVLENIENVEKWEKVEPKNLIDAIDSLLDAHMAILINWEKRIKSLPRSSRAEWRKFKKQQTAYLGPVVLFTESKKVMQSILRGHLSNVLKNQRQKGEAFVRELEDDVSRLRGRVNSIDFKVAQLLTTISKYCEGEID